MKRMQIHSLFMVILLIVPLISALDLDSSSVMIREKEDYELSAIDYLGMSPDPHLESAPDVATNGTPGVFNSSYHSSSGVEDPSYIELIWDHAPNDTLQFHPDNGISECSDFIYFTQTLDWPYSEMPLGVELVLNRTILESGTFETEWSSWRMFETRAWIIDALDEWILIGQANPGYTAFSFTTGRYQLNTTQISQAWEHAEEGLTLAIGLTPTLNFLEYDSSEPWRYYNGSVQFRVSDVDIYVKMEVARDPSSTLEPLFNATWDQDVSEVLPSVEEDGIDLPRDITTGDDGAVYVVGTSTSPYDVYLETGLIFRHEVLLKYDSELNLLWCQKNINMSNGFDVTVSGGYVYTGGSIKIQNDNTQDDVYITKWTPDGTRVWSAQWGGYGWQAASSLTVGTDNSVYVLAQDWHHDYDADESSLLKFNSAGTLLWNKTIHPNTLAGLSDIYYANDLLILSYYSDGFISVRNLNGNELYNISYLGQCITYYSDYIYLYNQRPTHQIEKWSLTQESIWNASFSRSFSNGDPDPLFVYDIGISPEGDVFVYSASPHLSEETYFTKFNNDGTHNWTKSIGKENWKQYSYPPMCVSPWGVAYFAPGEVLEERTVFSVYAYALGEYTLPKPVQDILNPVPIMLVAGGGVIALIIIVGVLRRRR